MASGASSVSQVQSRRRQRRERGSLLLRLRTYLMRRHLDARLAAGADPEATATLRLRAEQLASKDGRARIAKQLERVLGGAHGPDKFRLVLQPHRPEIRENTPEIQDLITRLRDAEPITARGAARSSLLVTRGESPFDANRRVGVGHAVHAARQALDEPGVGQGEGEELALAA